MKLEVLWVLIFLVYLVYIFVNKYLIKYVGIIRKIKKN